ncbi:hypothetical protein A3A64_04225 [Candidatus Gottesmanbacteria bacterium RIFCSPLOWO2_01_FULL_48_11]|uniref:PilT protein domain protein n=3 Tax=Candidatus Gottesmaniibacteriota TaxID=1752720 RepID=A0A0G1UMH8_9BACT|nr:MAG: PilT protein domain protein [Candidatus Gottesmanbacteria bacterium GW2011_GWA2_47_9]KKU95339.1 MAG: PilT protein domain protein [Candidatus Gottesmanbacteria bacterium GW2011_GWA1_48_13]OGG27885.1 MAG: hypothetical protein A3A64_04225 [Candidatus Gottesmanbacteria bacterium RIFCSPLOWO2_01_FULL_48_11]
MGKALLDANVLVAVYRPTDELHKQAVRVVSELKDKGYELVFTNLLIQETATVLSMRVGMDLARKFLTDYHDIISEEIFIDEDVEKLSWNIFLQQHKKGTSFVDCANLAVIEKYKLDGIVSFDTFYPKELRIGV